MELESCRPPVRLFRIGRKPQPWAAPDWAFSHEDGTFGNRFDDPEGSYRVLYASSQRISCFAETLARFRPSLEVLAELGQIEGDNDFAPLSIADWVSNRRIGAAAVQGNFADIYAAGWISMLRRELAGKALQLGLRDVDAATLQAGEPRGLTQQASLRVRFRAYDGIYYRSRFGHGFENWAIFEPWSIEIEQPEEIPAGDPDMLAILNEFQILCRP